jgi:hypothetical protein
MSNGRVNWSMLLIAIACLVPVLAGVALLLSDRDGGDALAFALIGFFGAGTVVLGRKALTG